MDNGNVTQCKEVHEVNIFRDPNDNRKVLNGYKICQNIGEGAYAKVKLVYQPEQDEFFAFKKFNKTILQKKTKIVKQENGDIMYKTLWDNVEKEIEIHKTLSHENILKLYEIIHDEEQSKVYLVLEYAYNGEVLTWDENKQIFKYNDERKNQDYNYIQNIMRGTLLGLKYLHSRNIVHRDIKPQNILVDPGDVAKLCDFGTAHILSKAERLKGTEGTYHFMAPETLKDFKQNGYDGKLADIFSLGITFYCLIYRKLPFNDYPLMELFNQIQKQSAEFKEGPPPLLINLIQKMISKNPKERPSLDQILTDKWFDVEYPVIDYDSVQDQENSPKMQQQQVQQNFSDDQVQNNRILNENDEEEQKIVQEIQDLNQQLQNQCNIMTNKNM